LNLNCDRTISVSIVASDKAADAAGRRRTASQKKFRKAQVSSASAVANNPYSVWKMLSSAAT
jgi:hypothetical protein